jgi:acetyl/propionyl-CoA carboxylase alpha subunit
VISQRIVTKLLVANRGEIAERIVRSAHDLGIATVAVFSDADADARFVRAADEAVRLPGTAPADTYLRADLIVDAALRTGADAVHPGYGFLSEQAAFARACADAGLVFVGPPVAAIELMGSKLAAKALMSDAGVPVLPGATVTDDMTGPTGGGALLAAGEGIGYPILVKASAGGGGRGMRAVHDAAQLVDAVAAAQRESAAAFGDGTVFLERLVEHPRHVEVQVLADAHGNVVHLFERECSIQRRHQKVIEEAPSPAVDDELRALITGAAVAAARAVGYVNAGTVEFVLAPDGTFAFLEMNTRLQVEHPVTEMVTGNDLVALQLRIAQGERLPDEVFTARLHGHAIEARLYAEDVAAGYLPTSGRLDRFVVPIAGDVSGTGGVRVDTGYGDGSVVSTFYDAMLAKVIAWAPTREEAARRLAEALRGAQLHGPITNRDLLVAVLRHPEFLAGATDTGFLDRHDAAAMATSATSPSTMRLHAVAAVLAAQAGAREGSPLPAGIPVGWRNVGPATQPVELVTDDGAVITVAITASRAGLVATVDGESVLVVVPEQSADAVTLELDGHRTRCSVQRIPDAATGAARVYVDSPLGATAYTESARFPLPAREEIPGSLVSPMPGTVVRVDAVVGASVAAGTPLVALEAMKMEHTLRAPHGGTVSEVRVMVGDQVDTGTVLVVVQPDAGEEDAG